MGICNPGIPTVNGKTETRKSSRNIQPANPKYSLQQRKQEKFSLEKGGGSEWTLQGLAASSRKAGGCGGRSTRVSVLDTRLGSIATR